MQKLREAPTCLQYGGQHKHVPLLIIHVSCDSHIVIAGLVCLQPLVMCDAWKDQMLIITVHSIDGKILFSIAEKVKGR